MVGKLSLFNRVSPKLMQWCEKWLLHPLYLRLAASMVHSFILGLPILSTHML